jgi:hypothetical protein
VTGVERHNQLGYVFGGSTTPRYRSAECQERTLTLWRKDG